MRPEVVIPATVFAAMIGLCTAIAIITVLHAAYSGEWWHISMLFGAGMIACVILFSVKKRSRH
jgi:hypothetical protein